MSRSEKLTFEKQLINPTQKMATHSLQEFIDFLSRSLQNKQFIRIILSNKRIKTSELKTVTGRLIMLKWLGWGLCGLVSLFGVRLC